MRLRKFAEELAEEYTQWTNRLLAGMIIMGALSLITAISVVVIYASGNDGEILLEINVFASLSGISFALMSIAALAIERRISKTGPAKDRNRQENPAK